MKYECHITMVGDPEYLARQVDVWTDWHFSRIDGDPVLGAGVKCYATKNFVDLPLEECISHMGEIAACLPDVVRLKVEEIVYDERL